MKLNKLLVVGVAGAVALGVGGQVNLDHTAYASQSQSNTDLTHLQDGVYHVGLSMMHAYTPGKKSMSDGAVDKSATKLIVENGEYKVRITFKPLTRDFGGKTFTGYLGNLKYYSGGAPINCRVVEWYSESDKDNFMDVYFKKYPNRKAYPKVLEYPVDKNAIVGTKLETRVQVFVPVMESLMVGVGTQDAKPIFDLSGIRTTSTTTDLSKDKATALKQLKSLNKLTQEQINAYTTKINSAKSVKEINAILEQAKKDNANSNNPNVTPSQEGSWQQNSTGWWYQNADGSYPANEWKQINGEWYWFDESGYMQTGWQSVSGTWYYFTESGAMAHDTWIDGTYYVSSNGSMLTNTTTPDGYMVDGSGAWVPTAPSQEGSWEQNSTGWWYQNADGSYPANEWKQINGEWYWFDESGYMQTGWQSVSGTWYYFTESGAMAHDTWIDGTYYVSSNGSMLTNMATPDGYMVDGSGAWVK